MSFKKNRTPKDFLILFLKGMSMGAADVVPGVSGGTIAFISGIYEELLDSIKAIPNAALTFLKGKIKDAWNQANAPVMAVLLSGIALSVLTLAGVITHLLEHYPIPVWSFFFGLIVASVWFVGKSMNRFDVQSLILFLLATAGAYLITVATPSTTPEGLPFIFFSGVVAICAMILPGISGSFILLLMGKYHFIMQALKEVNISIIITFALGCLLGILSFARVVSFMFRRYHNATLAVLTGFMLGSLNKVWPWKEVLERRINSHGESVPFIEKSILPGTYAELTGQHPQVGLALALAGFGFLLVFGLETLAEKTKK
jgi:putative membrane protein